MCLQNFKVFGVMPGYRSASCSGVRLRSTACLLVIWPRMLASRPLPLAILVNLQRGWTKAERSRIDAALQAAGLTVENVGKQLGTAAKRELIKAALAESPEESHRKIAARLAVSNSTVGIVCAEVCESNTSECRHGATGQGARTDRKLAARPQVSKEDLLARNAQIVREHDEERSSWDEIGGTPRTPAAGCTECLPDREPAKAAEQDV